MRNRSRRVGVFLAVVAAIALVAAGLGAVLSPSTVPVSESDGAAYDVETIRSDPTPTDGDVSIDVDGDGTVLIDHDHSNDFEPEDLQHVADALHRDGHAVRYHERGDDLRAQLANATAFVVVAPQSEFSEEDAAAVEAFVDEGGRLLILGEPNQGEVTQTGPMAVEMRTVRGEATSLGERFGMRFGTDFLYNMAENDGNYRNVFAVPADDASLSGVDRTAVHTATRVEPDDGTPVLVATEGTRSSLDGTQEEYGLAVRNDTVLGVGDATFLLGSTATVADNDAFTESILRFLLTGSFDGTELESVSYDPVLEESPDDEPAENATDEDETEEVNVTDPTGDEPGDDEDDDGNESDDEPEDDENGDEGPENEGEGDDGSGADDENAIDRETRTKAEPTRTDG